LRIWNPKAGLLRILNPHLNCSGLQIPNSGLNKPGSKIVSFRRIGNFWHGAIKVLGNKGGYTIYHKTVNKYGKTKRWFHDSYNQAGKWLHREWNYGTGRLKKWWDGKIEYPSK
jgi:hypothetical protein